jgi:hypothetical protein
MVDIKREPTRYLHGDDVDWLARQNTQLMTELWIVKDRLAVLESLLEKKGLLSDDEVDNTPPDEALGAELDQRREQFVKRIIGMPPSERSLDTLKDLGTG